MVAVRMMQVAVDQIIDVIAVRHRLVPTARAVHVTRLVARALVIGRAAVRIALRHLDHVLVDVIPMRVMQVTVVDVVDMITVAHGRVAAVGAVLMRVMLVMRQ